MLSPRSGSDVVYPHSHRIRYDPSFVDSVAMDGALIPLDELTVSIRDQFFARSVEYVIPLDSSDSPEPSPVSNVSRGVHGPARQSDSRDTPLGALFY